MPVADCFIDTNILLYAIGTDPAEASKTAVARRLLVTRLWTWSGQVAAEFISASTSSKRPKPQTLAEAEQFIDAWSSFDMVAIDRAIVKSALAMAARHGIPYYDAQVLAAAKQTGCGLMFSEDLNHGQLYDGVRVVNPFLPP